MIATPMCIVLATIERTIVYKNENGILFCNNSNIQSISPINYSIPQLANNAQQLNLKLLGKKQNIWKKNFFIEITLALVLLPGPVTCC